jgi:AmmeMemoRadiSam system protein B
MKLKAVVAGQFYPGGRKGLQAALKAFEKRDPIPPLEGKPVGLLLPHAGYPYSGSVAALGYQALPEPFDTVVVAGPSHYVPFRGVSVFAGEAVETPLGELPVDQEAATFLMDFDSHIAEIPPAFAREHSVEVHLPMIQTYLPKAKVVPIVMGQGLESAVEPLSEALLALSRKKKFLLVASSDLSHYPVYETAVTADRQFLEALLTGDEKKVDQVDEKIMAQGYSDYYCTHCGKEPVSTLLRFSKGMKAGKSQLLAYRNSGDATGDRSRVVGYSAVAFCR